MIKNKKINLKFGFAQWNGETISIEKGCDHFCLYCGVYKRLVEQFGNMTKKQWMNPTLNQRVFNKGFRKKRELFIFPNSHDITMRNVNNCVKFAKKIINYCNRLMIISKPHLEVIKILCNELKEYKDKIFFRFTLTSDNNDVLRFWERKTSTFEERKDCVEYVYTREWENSSSIEPYLTNPIELIEKINPMITGDIWVGKMNNIRRENIPNTHLKHYNRIRELYSVENISELIKDLRKYRKIKYKESIIKIALKNNLEIPQYQLPFNK